MAKVIDTLKAANILSEAGIRKREAEAIVSVVAEAEGNLATKSDLELVRSDLNLLESRITNKIYAIGLTIGTLVVGVGVFL